MVRRAKLIISVLSMLGGIGFVWGDASTTKLIKKSPDQFELASANSKTTKTEEFQLSEESLRAFSIKPNPQQQQSAQLAPTPAKTVESKDTEPKTPTSPITKPKPPKLLHLELVTPLGDEYSLDESDDSSIRFRVTYSKDLESCTGILHRVGQTTRFEGEIKGAFRYDPSHQVRSAPISIEILGNKQSATVRTDYITWDRYGYETSRRSCVLQAACN